MFEDEERFFAKLPALGRFREVVEPSGYQPVPDSWLMFLTDVRGSTLAIERGRYKDVNAVGAAAIIALRNALPEVELPFTFGGDGATVLVPGSSGEVALVALRGLRELARSAFQLDLRCAVVPVGELHADGHQVSVAKFRASPNVTLAMFMGDGFSVAEQWVKDPHEGQRYFVEDGPGSVNLEGFECRWRPVPSRRGVVVSLLVSVCVKAPRDKAQIYAEVLDQLELLAKREDPNPISSSALRLQGPFGDFSVEAKARSGQAEGDAFRTARAFARNKAVIGNALLWMGREARGFDGANYRAELVQNCDYRKFDEMLRMVIDLAEPEADRLLEYLEGARALGRLCYGVHRSRHALVTCYVRSFTGDHVHFVDGAEGGYALAAKQLKAQLT